jgi:hypothetical protein
MKGSEFSKSRLVSLWKDPLARDPADTSRSQARGSASWFPKNLPNRVRVLLRLPARRTLGNDPLQCKFMGVGLCERRDARYIAQPGSQRTGTR